ncbi:MAG: UDP-N-acetylmuramate--L-alanine ligase [Bacillota bacterium]
MLNIGLLDSKGVKRIHFTGIGGISMSGLAEILANQGYIITGSDIRPSAITQKLEKMGIKVTIGHQAENVTGADLLVYTAAVKQDNPELLAASKAGLPLMDRATLLGELMKKYPFSIAVSGTHGKTTTTAMISTIMIEAGLDPTVHIGGEYKAIGGTTRIGKTGYFITEACEYTGSFLKFNPYLALILNIEYDHADYFRSFDEVKNAFLNFSKAVPEKGWLLVNGDDPSAFEIMRKASCNKVAYGIRNNCCWTASDISLDNTGCASYLLVHDNKPVTEIKLKVPGLHNVSNSLAALAAADIMGCNLTIAAKALLKFHGVCRRFELKGSKKGVMVVDDYAHHPSEVAATLNAARSLSPSRIWCVFQPHTYTRTKYLMDEFSTAFNDADVVILPDIYAAREDDTGEVNSAMLAEKISVTGKKVVYIKEFEDIAEYLNKNTEPGDLVITMGAGDIYKVGEIFLNTKKKLAVS